MNCIDLFAGAGGLTEGFIKTGYNIIAHVEKEYAASLTLRTRLAYHYLKENNKLDIYKQYLKQEISRDKLYSYIPQKLLHSVINEEISDETVPNIFERIDEHLEGRKVDIVIGGPPCQAYSLLGRASSRDGMKSDKRNYLYKQYLKFLEKYQPNIFVFENVKGLLSAKDKNDNLLFDKIRKEMKDLGYRTDWKMLDSSKFMVPQRRNRVIIIGWKEGFDFSYPEFEENQNNGNINQLFSDLPKMKSNSGVGYRDYPDSSNDYLQQLGLRDESWDILTQHISRKHNDRDLEIYKLASKKMLEGKRMKYTDVPSKLQTHKNLKSFLDRFKVVDGNDISHTMVAHISKDGHHYIHPDINQNRSITVREAARIQSFPDDYYFENSRTSAFIQIGNAVPPLMAEKIARKIKEQVKNQ